MLTPSLRHFLNTSRCHLGVAPIDTEWTWAKACASGSWELPSDPTRLSHRPPSRVCKLQCTHTYLHVGTPPLSQSMHRDPPEWAWDVEVASGAERNTISRSPPSASCCAVLSICSGTKLVYRNIHQLPSLSLFSIPHPKQVPRPLVPSGHLKQETSGLSSICLLPCVKRAQGPSLARATRTEGLRRPGTGWFGNSHAGLLQTGLWSSPGGGGALGSI